MAIRWRRILIHHSATPDGAARNFDAIRRFHVDERGWRDIGYHYVVEQVGDHYVAMEGRSSSMVGAHCPGQNGIALGVCLVGDWSIEQPPAPQVACLVDLLARLCLEWKIIPAQIKPHREYKQTACPGDALAALLPEIRARVAAQLGWALTGGLT